ncbi:MAG: YlxM family DNA-binding protein [bacterium]
MGDVEEHIRFAELLRIYGNLLSERQQEYMHLHYMEDLSYGEIAEQSDISRQAVHDAIVHARKSLQRFEHELSLLSVTRRDGPDMKDVLSVVNRLEKIASEDILYDTRRLKAAVRELKALLTQEPANV